MAMSGNATLWKTVIWTCKRKILMLFQQVRFMKESFLSVLAHLMGFFLPKRGLFFLVERMKSKLEESTYFQGDNKHVFLASGLNSVLEFVPFDHDCSS
jgi:hypothetical protein